MGFFTANLKKHLPHRRKQHKRVDNMKLNKTDEKVVAALQAEGKELTLQELTDKTGEPSKKVFRSLRKLFENEIIETKARKYKLLIMDTKDIKAKLANKSEEEPPA
jgi:uncharacterized membrane protein